MKGLRFLIGLVLSVASVSTRSDVAFSDGNLQETDWVTVVSFHGHEGIGSSQWQSGDGNPGSFRQVTIQAGLPYTDGTKEFVSSVTMFCGQYASLYDPCVSGPIRGIDFSVDYKRISGAGQGWSGPALQQGGRVFIFSPYPIPAAGSWAQMRATNVTAAQFIEVGPQFGELYYVDRHPDFGPTGMPIVFGFWAGMSGGFTGGSELYVDGFDNWSIVVHQYSTKTLVSEAIRPAVEIAWASTSNQLYLVEYREQVVGTNWFVLAGPIAGNGNTNYFFDNTRLSKSRFYRIVEVE